MAAAKKFLVTHVHVTKKDGTSVILSPGQEIPGWAKDLVTNPKALRAAAPEESGDAGSGAAGDGNEKPDGYAAQSGDDLKAELKRRELPVSGSKAELVARLEEHDKQVAADAAAAGAGGDAGSGAAGGNNGTSEE